jgi:predicted lipoprotein with Yx(FWY)xxD motif
MPSASSGVRSALISTSVRADGSRQVTYAGHPLYRYAGDSGPGTTNGQGSSAFGAKWYVVAPSGQKIDTD